MKILLTEHAKIRAKERGTSYEEIKEVLESGNELFVRHNRKAKEKIFDYNDMWLGNFYPEKKVRVIYTEEKECIVVITVIVYYGKWR